MLIASITIGILLVLPHLHDEVWQDEAYTLIHYASKGPLYPFTEYRLPNNHLLFSSILSLWWHWGDGLVHTRILLLIFFLLTLSVFAVAAYRAGGILSSVLATALFATNNVTHDFALQLRGYAPSWLFVSLAFLGLPRYVSSGKWPWALLYIAASASVFAIIPTNVLISLIFIGWGWWEVFAKKELSRATKAIRLSVITSPLLIGGLAYAQVLDQLFRLSHVHLSQWTRTALLGHFSWSVFSDFWYLLPLSIIGSAVLLVNSLQRKSNTIGTVRSNAGLLLVTLSFFVVFLVLIPATPFPRNFVPLLPIVFYLVAHTTESAIQRLKRFERTSLLTALLAVSVLYYAPTHRICESEGLPDPNLCTQYYHQSFHPQSLVTALQNFAKGNRLLVATDFDGLYSMGYVIFNDHRPKVALIYYRNWNKQFPDKIPRVIVVGKFTNLRHTFEKLGVEERAYKRVHTAGFFRVFVRAE